ncbi:MAG: hypothetical protein C4528_02570, partial [Gammaproteobacteria bacterium]
VDGTKSGYPKRRNLPQLILLLFNAVLFIWYYNRAQPAATQDKSAATVPPLKLLREVQSTTTQSQTAPAPQPEPEATPAAEQ